MLKAGTYYIGDPCYVLNEQNGFDWQDVCDTVLSGERIDGEFTVKRFEDGREFNIAVFSTKYGDGCYTDQLGHEYPVDAGLLSAIPIEALDPAFEIKKLGMITVFDTPFESNYNSGKISFGKVCIDTDPEDDDWENSDAWYNSDCYEEDDDDINDNEDGTPEEDEDE